MIRELLVDAAGNPKLPQAIYDDAVAWLLLGALVGADPASIPRGALEHLGRFAERAGLTDAMSDEQCRQRVDAYFTAHPLPADLRVRLEQALREAALSTDGPGAALAALGLDQVKGTLERKAPPPDGAVAAGPMARFLLRK
jgi:hypothetical protein